MDRNERDHQEIKASLIRVEEKLDCHVQTLAATDERSKNTLYLVCAALTAAIGALFQSVFRVVK